MGRLQMALVGLTTAALAVSVVEPAFAQGTSAFTAGQVAQAVSSATGTYSGSTGLGNASGAQTNPSSAGNAASGITLPDNADRVPPVAVGATSVYPNVATDVSYALRSISGGEQALIIASGSRAPTTYTFRINVPSGGHLVSEADGSVLILDKNRNLTGAIAAPWAKDARGRSMPTSYQVHGDTVVQTVNFTGATYPVVADPSVKWNWWGYSIRFSKWETGIIAGGFALADRYFGWASWAGVAAQLFAWAAAWAITHGYCLAMNYTWAGIGSPWYYRC